MTVRLLTEDALVRCEHRTGLVPQRPGQRLVTVEGRAILVRDDPERRPIGGCSQQPPLKPCTVTGTATAGYSGLVTVEGSPVVRDDLTGLTDGVPVVAYEVAHPGQDLVGEAP